PYTEVYIRSINPIPERSTIAALLLGEMSLLLRRQRPIRPSILRRLGGAR
ncbi:MAG: hypothetical protein ACI9NC_004924, partial [Verrucomicrobiales bacterium]